MNKKRYWLRGGIIGILVWGVSTLILIPLDKPVGSFELPYRYYPSGIVLSPIHLFFEYIYDTLSNSSMFFIAAIALSFVHGVVIGWIYGKIRSPHSSYNMIFIGIIILAIIVYCGYLVYAFG